VECRNSADCNDTNACTTDTCNAQNICDNPTLASCTPCTGNAVSCVNNDIQRCNNGVLQITECGGNGCLPGSTACTTCTVGQLRCSGTTLQECRVNPAPAPQVPTFVGPLPCSGLTFRSCPTANGTPMERSCDDSSLCTTDACTQTGCVNTLIPSNRGSGCACTDANQCAGELICAQNICFLPR
jgi:hypothetical protein